MIECVCNISEGRDAAVIERIAAAPLLGGCRVVDVHADPDHHRSVITFLGAPSAAEDGALALVRETLRWIDLREHAGVHPRFGAVDVVPFVPLCGDRMEDAIAVARRVGKRIAGLGIPVFLYGHAARGPEHTLLSELRRGGIPGLACRMDHQALVPDFGPPSLHPSAGACAVGARDLLVAYNIVLESRDLCVGREVATCVRHRDGGLPGVQALAFWLESANAVQVSMNLTDVEAITVPDVFMEVRRLAARHGVEIRSSELVGLAPRAALRGADRVDLRLLDRWEDHVLEATWKAAENGA